MNPISREFAPPLNLIAPFFKYGVIFYLISMLSLLFMPASFDFHQFNVAGWVHLFMLGFVMMVIFGAMAQLVPVVLEVGHVVVDVYYVILPLLGIGSIMMVLGFWIDMSLLPYGGLLVLVSMLIFAMENLATLKKTKLDTLTVDTIKWSNGYLLLGILTGFFLALGFNGLFSIDIALMLKAHVYAVIGGYVVLTIIGLSLTLIPMFSLAHGFDEKPIHLAFKLVIGGVGAVFVGALLSQEWLMYLGYIITFAGIVSYLHQIYIIAILTVRKELDIWAKSMIFAFGSLIFAMMTEIVFLLTNDAAMLHTTVWFLLLGFISSMITGHLYKIVPFLVWFERFSPLVGKQKVPMLHEMYDKRGASFMFNFTASGVIIGGFGLLLESDLLFGMGASFMFAGAIFLYMGMNTMLSYGANLTKVD
jgi:hypothetical protein